MATISCTSSIEQPKPLTERADKSEESIPLDTSKRSLSTTCACCIRPHTANALSWRQVLGGATAVATAAVASFPTKSSEQSTPRRIDVHHHFASPSWLQAMKLIGADDPVIANWSAQKSLDDMDRGGVVTAVLSATPPQVRPLAKEATSAIARDCDEYAKQLAMGHPGRLGLFAMLPLPETSSSEKAAAGRRLVSFRSSIRTSRAPICPSSRTPGRKPWSGRRALHQAHSFIPTQKRSEAC
jgi:hypothetical protein